MYLLIVLIIFWLWFAFSIYRLNWVAKRRLKLINNMHVWIDADGNLRNSFDAYWSFDKMLWSFWIWDMEKMRHDR